MLSFFQTLNYIFGLHALSRKLYLYITEFTESSSSTEKFSLPHNYLNMFIYLVTLYRKVQFSLLTNINYDLQLIPILLNGAFRGSCCKVC